MKGLFAGMVGIVAVILAVNATSATPEKARPLEEILADFVSSDWPKVSDALEELIPYQGTAIPDLIDLLERPEYVKLENTMDLIYPGATTFYGHGTILDYDIDWISIRAGWAIESLTFQDFGFRAGVIDHDELLMAVIRGKADRPLDQVIDLNGGRMPPENLQNAVKAAKKWWKENRGNWTRLKGLIQALNSSNPRRQVAALAWIRYGEDKLDSFSREMYIAEIYPRVKDLARSKNKEVVGQAKYLVRDYENNEWYWYSLKKK